jgi:hypothetical protein
MPEVYMGGQSLTEEEYAPEENQLEKSGDDGVFRSSDADESVHATVGTETV